MAAQPCWVTLMLQRAELLLQRSHMLLREDLLALVNNPALLLLPRE